MCITRAPEGEGVRQVRQEQARYGRVRQVRQVQARSGKVRHVHWSGRSDRSGRVRQEQARYSRIMQSQTGQASFLRDILLLMVESQAAESGGSRRFLILPARDFWSKVTDRPLHRRNRL